MVKLILVKSRIKFIILATTQLQKKAMIYQILKTPRIGPVSFWKELNKLKTLAATFESFQTKFGIKNFDASATEIENFAQLGIICIGFWQSAFPKQLKRLHDAPPLLWAKSKTKDGASSSVDFLGLPQIAIVGGRNASFHGIKFAQDLSQQLSDYGFTIVSGLARGIDKAAHQGALKNRTIAVVAGGVDRIYPHENTALYEQICQNHLVVSEMPPGVEPNAELFPRRNRIIAALSNGICIIEAALKSGSLLTAKYGLDLGLPIFACPGHPYDPRTKGSNQLIKDGASLLDNAQDVIEQIPIAKTGIMQPIALSPAMTLRASTALHQEILNFLNHTPVKIEALLEHLSTYSTEQILIALSELELKAAISRLSADLVVLG